ncbi:hypothetical protein [Thermosulfurimonas sp.]|uniref:hypothetical protein n=1 Tax=Thermosulfurimonas sp. TaxID=2080236 RepID=UPI0025FFCFA6|nr:hypothetical protein [Thermosulfurimonas sp.]
MRIQIEGQVVYFRPENEREARELDRLWKVLTVCEGENRKIQPMGIYTPGATEAAQFFIEGVKPAVSPEKTIRYVCMICNRMEEHPAGKAPICCGQPMIPMD